MSGVLYDETAFPEYWKKLAKDKRRAINSFLGGVFAYIVALAGFLFLLFPQSTFEQQVQIAVGLLSLPAFFSLLSVLIYKHVRRHPMKVTEEAILGRGRPVRLQDILELVWMGAERGAIIRLDPQKYRISSWSIPGEDIVRPQEFLRALEGRVKIAVEESPTR